MAKDYDLTLDCGCKVTIYWVEPGCAVHDAPISVADEKCELHVVGVDDRWQVRTRWRRRRSGPTAAVDARARLGRD